MNRRQRIALYVGIFFILLAISLRPIEKRTVMKSGFVTYRDIAEVSPIWDWFVTRHDSFSLSRFPYSSESPDGTKEELDLNWTFYFSFIGAATLGTILTVRILKRHPSDAKTP